MGNVSADDLAYRELLVERLERIDELALAPDTALRYQRKQREFIEFTVRLGLADADGLCYSATNVALFLIDGWQRGLSPETLQSTVHGAIERGARTAGLTPGTVSKAHRVRAVLQAARRTATKPIAQSYGVTYPHAATVCRRLARSKDPNGLAAAAAIATASTGMMRMGELISRGRRRGMRADQCEINEDHAIIYLDRHKGEQRITRLPVHLPDTEVMSARMYIEAMQQQPRYDWTGPLIQNALGVEPPVSQVVRLLRTTTPRRFLKDESDRQRLTGHSMRAGAAFSALSMGVPLRVVQLMGRWRSAKSITQRYDRTSAQQLMNHVRTAAKIDPAVRPNRVAPYVQI